MTDAGKNTGDAYRRKHLPTVIAVIGVLSSVIGQGQVLSTRSVELLGSATAPETDSPDSPVSALPDGLAVLSSRTHRVHIIRRSLEVDLPPMTETIDLTLQVVEEPDLPEPDSDTSTGAMASPEENLASDRLFQDLEVLVVSATVYDHSRTFLHIYPNGRPEMAASAWTNLDLNHFIGFTRYRTDSEGTIRDHSLLLNVNNIDTAEQRRLFTGQNQEYSPPDIPELPDRNISGPAFEMLDGDMEGRAKQSLQEIHELHRKEGELMAAAFLARTQEEEAARAERTANPTSSNPVTFRFWKRSSSGPSQDPMEETAR